MTSGCHQGSLRSVPENPLRPIRQILAASSPTQAGRRSSAFLHSLGQDRTLVCTWLLNFPGAATMSMLKSVVSVAVF
jgi:hypothetical protein